MRPIRNLMLPTALFLLAGCTLAVAGGAKLTERTSIEIDGPAGKVAKLLGGKAASKDGLEREIAVSATRKGVRSGDQREVFDVEAEAMWKISKGDRKCVKTTFAELRERWESLSNAGGPMSGGVPEGDGDRPESDLAYVVDMDTKTGGPRTVAGHEGTEKIVTMTVHRDGMTLEEGGGSIVELTLVEAEAELPALKVLREFDRAYAEALAQSVGFDMPDFKEMILRNPAIGQAMTQVRESGITGGASILSTRMEVSTVPAPGQGDADADQGEETPKPARGMAGRFAGKLLKNRREKQKTETVAAGPKRIYASDQSFVFIGLEPDENLLQLPESCPR